MIDRILLASESRDCQQSSIFESAPLVSGRQPVGVRGASASHDASLGKFTADELDQLSLFSTVALDSHDSSSASAFADSSRPKYGWSVIDIDSITTLNGLLEDHVKSAVSIDLIQEARVAFDQNQTQVS